MVSPARTVPPPTETDSAPEPARRRAGRIAVVLGIVAALAALAFPFAPVVQPQVTYAWQASDGPAAIPLMPYQPVQLTATVGCGAAPDPGLLLGTTPPRPDPAAQPLSGLQVRSAGGALRITSGGVELGVVPAGSCPVVITSDPRRTTVAVGGRTVITHDGDVRPDVAGAFTDARSGVGLTLTADTRFQTTISPLKAAIAAICVLALLGMLVALRRDDGPARRVPRSCAAPSSGDGSAPAPVSADDGATHGRRRRRLRVVDLAVTALLAVWWVIGSLTVDDGYISGIIRSRGENGFIGNVYRWLNAPEAPFSWFYDVFYAWSTVSDSTLWMRLPSTLLGLAAWALLSRGVLPRLGRFDRPWLAALAFGTWWIPYNLGLRPEPWVAVGVLGVFLAVERAIATRRVLPLALGLLLAGVTTALTPGGLIAFMPVLAGLTPLLRMVRANPAPVIVACVAAPSAAVLLMVSDQSLAAVLEGTRVRTLIGGGLPWFAEYQRYANLLEPGSFQASIGKRAAVLFTLLAAAGLVTALRRNRAGIATGPAGRLVAGFGLALVAMTFTPTKWTQHFGDLAGTGAAVLTLGLVAFASAPLRARVAGSSRAWRRSPESVRSRWPGTTRGPTPRTGSPRRSARCRPRSPGGACRRWCCSPAACWWGASSCAARGRGHEVRAGFPPPPRSPRSCWWRCWCCRSAASRRTAVGHRDSYTLASDALATVGGEPCGLERLLSVETDPATGLLPARPGPAARAELPVDIGGRNLPGIAVTGTTTTAWFALDAAQRAGELPVVVTTSGATGPNAALTLQFGRGDTVVDQRRVTSGSNGPVDVRQMAPAGADSVRLTVVAPTRQTRPAALVSLPRVPRLTPMESLLPPGSRAILDWPVAFLFGCITPEPLALGSAGLAGWRVAPPASDPSAGITYAPSFGGPFAAPRLLVTEQRMATYLAGDPTRDAAQLYRWVPVANLARPEPVVADRTVMGWYSDGRTRVPGLDTPG